MAAAANLAPKALTFDKSVLTRQASHGTPIRLTLHPTSLGKRKGSWLGTYPGTS